MNAKVKRGDVLFDSFGAAKVMAVADGYAMVRRVGCCPFIVALKDIDSERQTRWTTVDRRTA